MPHLPELARLARRLCNAVLPPPTCLVCGLPPPEAGTGEAVCAPCTEELPWNTRPCDRCAAPVLPTQEICIACELAPPAWDRAVAPLRYAPPVDTMIQRLKFRASLADGRWLAEAVAQAIRELRPDTERPELVVAVPMHARRRAVRGFNHAAFLADAVARTLPPLRADIHSLRRTRWTRPQAKLDAAERQGNLRDAIRWHGPEPPPRVAIIDDVLTTGATASAVATALMAAGAREVEVWACARAGRDPRGEAPQENK